MIGIRAYRREMRAGFALSISCAIISAFTGYMALYYFHGINGILEVAFVASMPVLFGSIAAYVAFYTFTVWSDYRRTYSRRYRAR